VVELGLASILPEFQQRAVALCAPRPACTIVVHFDRQQETVMSDIDYRTVLPEGWPRPRGFSHAVVARGSTQVKIAGQIGKLPTESTIAAGTDAGTQWARALANVVAVLAAAGGRPDQLIALRAYVNTHPSHQRISAFPCCHRSPARPAWAGPRRRPWPRPASKSRSSTSTKPRALRLPRRSAASSARSTSTTSRRVVAGFAKARAAHGQERVLVHCAMTSRRGKTLAWDKEAGKLKRLSTADYEAGVQGVLVASYRLASLSAEGMADLPSRSRTASAAASR
jgi:enamine deaminase RidA (YjgF/YER057c/UK114 family)